MLKKTDLENEEERLVQVLLFEKFDTNLETVIQEKRKLRKRFTEEELWEMAD